MKDIFDYLFSNTITKQSYFHYNPMMLRLGLAPLENMGQGSVRKTLSFNNVIVVDSITDDGEISNGARDYLTSNGFNYEAKCLVHKIKKEAK